MEKFGRSFVINWVIGVASLHTITHVEVAVSSKLSS
jgi:hypothetical protein